MTALIKVGSSSVTLKLGAQAVAFGLGGIPGGIAWQDIDGLVGWWDASEASSVTLNTGRVSVLLDLSDSGFHLSQPIAAKQPAYQANAINGLNALYYDGSRALRGLFSLPSAAFTVFSVSQVQNAGGSYKRTVAMWNDSNVTDFQYQQSCIPICHLAGPGVTSFYNSQYTIILPSQWDSRRVTYCAADSASVTTWENGASSIGGFGLSPSLFSPEQFWLGNSPTASDGAFAGWICEVILYERKLSAPELELVVEYLSSKWAIE